MPTAPCIVVVEDDQSLRNDLVEFLNLQGFAALGADSAERLWKLLSQWRVALVLLDIGLPDASGLDLAPELRAQHPLLGIVMLSALGADEVRVDGLRRGADAYLSKDTSLEVIEPPA